MGSELKPEFFSEETDVHVFALAMQRTENPHVDSHRLKGNWKAAHYVPQPSRSDDRADFRTDEKNFHAKKTGEKTSVMTSL